MADSLRLRFLGGADEIGGSCLIVEHGQERLLFDYGIRIGAGANPYYPELRLEAADNQFLFLTHGHLDHTGGYTLYRELFPDSRIAGSAETAALIAARGDSRTIEILQPWEPIHTSSFEIIPFPVEHSVPGAMGYIIRHNKTTLVLSGDFCTRRCSTQSQSVWSRVADVTCGSIDLFLCDGTGLLRQKAGSTEEDVARSLQKIFEKETGDIYATCFSSNWMRIHNLCKAALQTGRAVYFSGKSMKKSVSAASSCGFGVLAGIQPTSYKNQAGKKLIIAAGSQGEAGSAFYRLSTPGSLITQNDAVVYSATPVPGNELAVKLLLDRFARFTDTIYTPPLDDIHAGGHPSREEVAFVLDILQPIAWLPVHTFPHYAVSTFRGDLPQPFPIPLQRDSVLLLENGVQIEDNGTPSQRCIASASNEEKQRLYDDGFVHITVLRHGQELGKAYLTSRGFVRRRDSGSLLEELTLQSEGCAQEALSDGLLDSSGLSLRVKQELGEYIFKKTGKRPEIIVTFLDCSYLKG